MSADLALAFGRDVVLIDVVSARRIREMRLKDTLICSLGMTRVHAGLAGSSPVAPV